MTEKTVRLMGEVLAERQRQDDKWGRQDHDLTVWLTVLAEEVGEVAQAILAERRGVQGGEARAALRASRAGLRAELIQVAAVATPTAEWLDEHTCQECGCTDEAGCEAGCWWTEPGLCSQCDPRL